MNRFVISRDADRLTLTQPQDDRILSVGCPLFLIGVVSTTVLGLLGLIFDAQNVLGSGGDFFVPRRNHLGFLWAVALIGMLVFLPVYVLRTGRARTVWSFDRATDCFARNGRRLTALRRVEQVRVRALNDPDGRFLYHLFVIYGDGREVLLHQSYDDAEIWILAHEIGGFASVGVAG